MSKVLELKYGDTATTVNLGELSAKAKALIDENTALRERQDAIYLELRALRAQWHDGYERAMGACSADMEIFNQIR